VTHDLYEGFADRYEWFYKCDPEIVEFFSKLFSDEHVHRVLDCACGPARELLIFQSLGCEVVGSDISESMLAQARKNLAEAGTHIPLHKADYRELPWYFNEEFDAVVCWSASIVHMTDDDEVLRAFRSMRDVLKNGGILVLDQGITDRRWNEKKRFALTHTSKDVSQIYVIDYLGERDGRYNVLDLIHSDEQTDLKVWSADVHVALIDDQEKLLKAPGFKKLDFYGSYNFDPYDKETSLRLVAVAHK
jgi:glycine/sarcosine N-methyltransferase